MTYPDQDFTADCRRCFALCCIALRYTRADGFGHDKAAGQPCHLLKSDYKCGIHDRREELGYEGCIDFDCLGAGQRASAAFAGRNWQRDAGTARDLYAHFAQLLVLQEMRQALREAASLDLPADLEALRAQTLNEVASLADELDPDFEISGPVVLAVARDLLEQIAER
jgi:hypothetical protein